MVSIIVPIYNAARWLADCLESIANQKYEDYEVLMVDDGSKDSSASICQSYVRKDKRFHYFFQENAGVSVARNTGLDHACGEWVCFIDSDDMIDQNFLCEMYGHSNQCDAVCCGYSTNQKCLGKRGEVSYSVREDFIKDIIYEKGQNPQICTLLFRRSIIMDNSLVFTPGCVRNEDYEFFMRYLTLIKRPVAKIGFVGYFYRQNPQSVMHQKRSRMSVLMSIEASSNVGDAIYKIGVIPEKLWLTAFAVTTFLFVMSREKNKEVYDELHNRFPVKSFIRLSFCHGSNRVKGAAFLYSLLGRLFFYKVVSLFYRLKFAL